MISWDTINQDKTDLEVIIKALGEMVPKILELAITILFQIVFKENLLIEMVGRPDFQFGAFPEDQASKNVSPSSSGSFLVELKTVHDRFGKLKKDGSYTQLNAKLPTSPSEAHLMQCSFYSAVYNFNHPIFLVYACKDDHEIYDSTNCAGLTKEGLKKNYIS